MIATVDSVDLLKKYVVEVKDQVSSDEIDSFGKLNKIQNESFRLRTIIDSWDNQQSQDRALRESFARTLKWAFFIQAIIINVTFFLIGFGVIKIEPWVANTFIIAVFTELTSMIFIIIKYLFPKVSTEILDIIQKL
ncbi:MAG: hypothetical protein HF312_18845 [Ignavibacteria bacterium]|jgi:hypothetical protein|nr:hypothetical protein [Ignavibacteria bacterium]MCU7522281.1 hypothetical protein [Ignavibacteria bacterium]